MPIGDVTTVAGSETVHLVDTGMHDTDQYGSVYLVDAAEPAIVDSGIGTHYDRILDGLAEVGIDPADLSSILLTHIHLDHAGGAGHLLEACENATVLCHDTGVRHLVDPERLVEGTKAAVGDQWASYTEPAPIPDDRIEGIEDGDSVDLGDCTFDVVGAPGHAPHQVMFHDDGEGDADDGEALLFTGDAAGIYVPRAGEITQSTPPSQFDLDQCLADVTTIQDLAPDRLCFGHFGDLAYSRASLDGYKRTLVEWVEAIRQVRERAADDEEVVQHFVENARLHGAWEGGRAEAEARLNVRGVLGYLDYRGD